MYFNISEMKARAEVKNISYRVDFRQDFAIDEETAKKAGLIESRNISSYVYRHPKLNAEMMIFPSGEAFITGAKTRQEVESFFWELRKKLKDLGVEINLSQDIGIDIENILASANLRDYFPDIEINLEALSKKDNAAYDPDKMPAVFLTYVFRRMNQLVKGTAIIFSGGKVLIGDVKSEEDANLILEKVIESVR